MGCGLTTPERPFYSAVPRKSEPQLGLPCEKSERPKRRKKGKKVLNESASSPRRKKRSKASASSEKKGDSGTKQPPTPIPPLVLSSPMLYVPPPENTSPPTSEPKTPTSSNESFRSKGKRKLTKTSPGLHRRASSDSSAQSNRTAGSYKPETRRGQSLSQHKVNAVNDWLDAFVHIEFFPDPTDYNTDEDLEVLKNVPVTAPVQTPGKGLSGQSLALIDQASAHASSNNSSMMMGVGTPSLAPSFASFKP